MLTELRVAELLAETYVTHPISAAERRSVPSLCGHLDEVAALREAFFGAFHPRPEQRTDSRIVAVVARVIEATGITDERGQILAGQTVVRVLARVFNLTLTSYPWFEGRAQSIAESAVAHWRQRGVNSSTSPASMPKRESTPPTTKPTDRTSKNTRRPMSPPPETAITTVIDERTRTKNSAISPSPDGKRPLQAFSEADLAPLGVEEIAESAPLSSVVADAAVANDPEDSANQRSTPPPELAPLIAPSATATADLPSVSVTIRELIDGTTTATVTPAHERLIAAFKYLSDAMTEWRAAPSDSAQLERLRGATEATAEAAQGMLSRIPNTLALATATADISRDLGLDASTPVRHAGPIRLQSELESLSRLSSLVRRLREVRLPTWILPAAIPSGLRDSSLGWLQALSADNVLCEDLERCLIWTQAPHNQDIDLEALPEPPDEGPLQVRLAASGRLVKERRTLEHSLRIRIDRIATVYADDVLQRIREHPGDDATWLQTIAHAESLHDNFRDLGADLHPDAAATVRESVYRMDANADTLLAAARVVRDIHGAQLLRALSTTAAIQQLANRANNEPTNERVRLDPEANPGFDGTLSHPLSRPGATGGASTYSAILVWHRGNKALPYGIVWLPVRLSSTRPREEAMAATLEVRGDILKSSPREWLDFTIPATIDLPSRARTDLRIPIPLSELQADQVARRGKPLTLQISLSHSTWPRPVQAELTWRELRMELPTIGEPFPQNVPLEQMLARPLGIENRYTDLIALVQLGQRSFVVTGQRRFGKSTLIRGVVQTAKKFKDVAVLEEVVATGSDPVEVWRRVGRGLSLRFSRPVLDELEGGVIPIESAYDAVRDEAAKQGFKTIYAVIDEAQSLFATPARSRLAETLKDRLERSWGVGSATRAAIRVGLVGQTHLRRLLGTNLLGALPAAFPAEAIRADDLLPLLRDASSDGIQSTAEARERLAVLAGNLYILDQILQGILSRCRAAGRSWFYESDVDETADRLVENYQKGTDLTLWKYVRDVLNESDDLEQWAPSETFPVALAWARALDEGLHDEEGINARVLEVLQAWARGTVILEGRVTDAVETLRASSVLNRSGYFLYPMLHRLLAVRAKASSPFESEAEREALDRLGMPRVRRPPEQDLVTGEGLVKGGQASIYRSIEGAQAVAVRCVRLDTQTARRRFMHEVDLLNKLNHAAPDSRTEWMDVMSHIPKVIRAGLAEDDRTLGVVLYQWVHGQALQRESLSDLAAIVIGRHLTAVLSLLSQMGIVHRDIRPENIIVRSGGQQRKPVLIDFGLARAVVDLQEAPDSLAGVAEFLPPEVIASRDAREWTPAGDIYSLGKTIEVCTRPDVKSPALMALINSMTLSAPKRRPSPQELNADFIKLDDDSRSKARQDSLKEAIRQQGQRLPKPLRSIAEASFGDVWACHIGLESDDERRIAAVAAFLEGAFEIAVQQHPDVADAFRGIPGSTYLSRVRDASSRLTGTRFARLVASESVATGHLRNANAHPNEFAVIIARAYLALGKNRPMQHEARLRRDMLRPAVSRVAQELDRYFNTDSISQFVVFWLDKQA